MSDLNLIVSNPPHRSPDPAAVAPHLDCSAAEVRMKLNFPAPEIWLSESDKEAARDKTKALLSAGVNVAWIPGPVLAGAPRAVAGTAAVVDGARFAIDTSVGELEVKAGDPVVAVLGEPVQQEARPAADTRSMLAQNVPGRGPVRNLPFVSGVATSLGGVAGYKAVDKLDKMAKDARDAAEKRLSEVQFAEPTEQFLDVYVFGSGTWGAARLASSHTDFSGLGDRKQPTARANVGAILDLLKEDYGARVDERLVKVTYKPSIVSGVALNQVLGRISEQLAGVPLLDVASVLAFLTSKGK